MAEPRLHLAPDAALRSVSDGLRALGHDVTDATADWVAPEERPLQVLLKATAQGRVVFTFRVRDYALLAKRHPKHAGVIVAVQHRWRLEDVIVALDVALRDPEIADWSGRVLWLNRWRVADTGGA